MPLSLPLRLGLRSPAIRTLTTTSTLRSKSPIGEAISRVARSEGGTEKGSTSAKLQSEATKALNRDGGGETAKASLGDAVSQMAKSEGRMKKGSEAAALQSELTKTLNEDAGSRGQSGAVDKKQQGRIDREANFERAASDVAEKLEKDPASVSASDAQRVQSREHRAHGKVDSSGISAKAQKAVDGKQ